MTLYLQELVFVVIGDKSKNPAILMISDYDSMTKKEFEDKFIDIWTDDDPILFSEKVKQQPFYIYVCCQTKGFNIRLDFLTDPNAEITHCSKPYILEYTYESYYKMKRWV